MTKLEAALYLFLILFIVTFLVDYIFIKRPHLKNKKNKKLKKKSNELTEVLYLNAKFKIDKVKLKTNNLFILMAFINAFIISLVAVIILIIDIHFIFQLMIGFILLIALIYSIYELLGRYLAKKGL